MTTSWGNLWYDLLCSKRLYLEQIFSKMSLHFSLNTNNFLSAVLSQIGTIINRLVKNIIKHSIKSLRMKSLMLHWAFIILINIHDFGSFWFNVIGFVTFCFQDGHLTITNQHGSRMNYQYCLKMSKILTINLFFNLFNVLCLS